MIRDQFKTKPGSFFLFCRIKLMVTESSKGIIKCGIQKAFITNPNTTTSSFSH